MSSSSSDRDYKTEVVADPSKFEQGMRAAMSSAATASTQIDAQFKRIGDAVSNVNKHLLGLTAVLAGGGALKKFISEANEWNGTAAKMAAQLGINTQHASVLMVALQHLGIDTDTFNGAAQRMSKQIFSNGQAFEKLGVQVKDATGHYRPITEVMAEVNQKLKDIKNPIEQNIAGQQVYGKSWAEVRSLLKLTSDEMAAAEKRARQLGLIVGPEGAAMSKQYSAQMRDLQLVGKSLEVQFGNALLPVFTRIGAFMSQEGPAAGQVFARVIEGVGFAASATWLALKDMGDGIGAIAAQAAALLQGDIEGFRAIGKARDEEAAKNEAAYEKLKAGFGKPLASAAIPDNPSVAKGPQYEFEKDKADPSRMGQWEAALAERKAAIERQGMVEGQYREMSKAEELKYWGALKAQRDLNATERAAVARKAAEVEMAMIRETFEVRVKSLQAEAEQYKNNTEARLAVERQIQAAYQAGTKEYEDAQKRIVQIERQAAEQRKAIENSRQEAKREAELQVVALEEQATQQALALGLITQQQALQSEQGFQQRRYEIAMDALQQRLQLAQLDPDRNPVEIERIQREIEQLEMQHQLRMGEIKNSMRLDGAKGPLAMLQTMEQGLTRVGTTLVTNWKQTGQVLRQTFAQIGTTFIQEMVIKPLAARVMAFAKERLLTLAGIGGDAAKAGSGAAASQASIPYVGPILAVAAMAAIFAAVSGMASSVPSASAAGGFDIPASLNPVTQLHAREMVLPAKHADVIRQLADQNQGVQAPAQEPIHLHGRPDDVVKLRDLPALLKKLGRDFTFV